MSCAAAMEWMLQGTMHGQVAAQQRSFPENESWKHEKPHWRPSTADGYGEPELITVASAAASAWSLLRGAQLRI